MLNCCRRNGWLYLNGMQVSRLLNTMRRCCLEVVANYHRSNSNYSPRFDCEVIIYLELMMIYLGGTFFLCCVYYNTESSINSYTSIEFKNCVGRCSRTRLCLRIRSTTCGRSLTVNPLTSSTAFRNSRTAFVVALILMSGGIPFSGK